MNNTLHFDGGSHQSCKGHYKPACLGFVLSTEAGTYVKGVPLPPDNTNNVAEMCGLIWGMREALERGIKELQVFGDSNLVISYMKGDYKPKAPHLKPLVKEAQQLAAGFTQISYQWIPREENTVADNAARMARDLNKVWEQFI